MAGGGGDDGAAVLVDTNEIQGKLPSNKFMGSSDGADDDGNIAAILVDTDTTIPALIAALNDLSSSQVNAAVDTAFTTQMADSVPPDGTIATREQAIYLVLQFLTEFAISGTTYQVKKVDGSASLAAFTLNDATNPTSITRS